MPQILSVHVQPEDRMDLVAARTLGDPEQFWRICDPTRFHRTRLTWPTTQAARCAVPSPQVSGEHRHSGHQPGGRDRAGRAIAGAAVWHHRRRLQSVEVTCGEREALPPRLA